MTERILWDNDPRISGRVRLVVQRESRGNYWLILSAQGFYYGVQCHKLRPALNEGLTRYLNYCR